MPDISAHICEPSGIDRLRWPVTTGLPFEKGRLRTPERVVILDGEGHPVPVAATATARWPDGSVKWALVDLQPTVRAMEQTSLTVRYGTDTSQLAPPPLPSPLRATLREEFIDVVTGALAIRLARRGCQLIKSVSRGALEFVDADGASSLTASDEAGKQYEGEIVDALIEYESPLRIVVKVSGRFVDPASGAPLLSWTTRLYFFAGHSFFKMYHTILHDQTARETFHLSRLSLRLRLATTGPSRARLGARMPDCGLRVHDFTPLAGRAVAIAQTEAHCHAIREIDGDIDLLDTASKGRTSEFAESGYGWLNLSDTERSVTIKLRRSARNYPNALAADGSTVRVDLFPDVTGWERESDARWRSNPADAASRNTMTMPQGMARTHETFFDFGEPVPEAEEIDGRALSFEQPLLLILPSQYYADSTVLGSFQPFREDLWPLELRLRALCSPPNGEGILDEGDNVPTSTDGNAGVEQSATDNLEGDQPRVLLRQFLRTGDQPLFWAAEAACFHLMDVDTVHASPVDPLWVGGPHRPGSVHHHYLDATHTQLSGPDPGAVWLGGLLDFYFLTGYERAREIAESCADFCRNAAPYDWRDELTSALRAPGDDAVKRGLPWPFRTRDVGWVLTGMGTFYDALPRERFLRSMEALVDMLEVWQDDEGRWLDAIGSHNRGASPAMTASVLHGLLLYCDATDEERARRMLVDGVLFLVNRCRSREGLFRQDESPTGGTPDLDTSALLKPLARVYSETANVDVLDAGYRLCRALLNSERTGTKDIGYLVEFMPVLDRLGLLEEFRAADTAESGNWRSGAAAQE